MLRRGFLEPVLTGSKPMPHDEHDIAHKLKEGIEGVHDKLVSGIEHEGHDISHKLKEGFEGIKDKLVSGVEHEGHHIADKLKGGIEGIHDKVVSAAEHSPIGGELVHNIKGGLSKTTEFLRPSHLLKLSEKGLIAITPDFIAWRVRLGAAFVRFLNWVRKPVDFVLRRIV